MAVNTESNTLKILLAAADVVGPQDLLKDQVMGLVFLLENLGFVINYPKSHLEPTQEIEFLGFVVNSQTMELKLPREKLKNNQVRGQEADESATTFRPRVLSPSRQDERGHTGNTNGPLVQQTLTVVPEENAQRLPGLRVHILPHPTGRGGAPLVGGTLYQLKWAEPHSSQRDNDDRDRCVDSRMGCDMWSSPDRRSMVKTGTNAPHQLPIAPSSHTGSELLCQGQGSPIHLAKDGQCCSTALHQQDGRNIIPGTHQVGQGILSLVHGEEHLPLSRTPPRCTEDHSGRRVQGYEGQDRLDALPPSLPPDQAKEGPSGGGPICNPFDDPAANILQLETRPSGNSNECLHPGLVADQGVRQPSMEPDRQSPLTSSAPASRTCLGSPDMESPTVVPSPTGDADGNPSANSSGGGANPPYQPARGNPPTSHVGYLRERYKECQLSEEATSLLLSSWRQKSSKSYDSLFGKWVSWCGERNADPISDPIGDVVNFLAELFQKGYQYRSLNAYRSAISSVHIKVDGYDVGQHPLVSRVLKGAFHTRPPQPIGTPIHGT